MLHSTFKDKFVLVSKGPFIDVPIFMGANKNSNVEELQNKLVECPVVFE